MSKVRSHSDLEPEPCQGQASLLLEQSWVWGHACSGAPALRLGLHRVPFCQSNLATALQSYFFLSHYQLRDPSFALSSFSCKRKNLIDIAHLFLHGFLTSLCISFLWVRCLPCNLLAGVGGLTMLWAVSPHSTTWGGYECADPETFISGYTLRSFLVLHTAFSPHTHTQFS